MRAEAGDRAAGIAMAAAAAGTILAMAHHPSGAHSGGLGGLVHGAMILFLAALAWGWSHFTLRRGLGRSAILAGLIAYGISVFAHIGAATINGFVVPALAARSHGAVGHDIFLFAWEANQALARLGVYATGAAFILWGADLLRGPGREARAVGALGLLCGAVPAALLASGAIGMNVAGAFIVYATHAAWASLVGVQLARSRISAGISHQD